VDDIERVVEGEQMTEIAKYDAATCVTAGELRKAGHTVPLTIPDIARVPRRSLFLLTGGIRDGSVVEWTWTLHLDAPLKRVELKISVGEGVVGEMEKNSC